VVTSILVFEDDGRVHEYVGGYSDWLRHNHKLAEHDTIKANSRRNRKERKATDGSTPKKLSYKDQREYDALPKQIEALEQALEKLREQTSDAGFYSRPYDETQPLLEEMQDSKSRMEALEERWLELDEQVQAFTKAKQDKT
jgi:ATP-binding cassette subfamily F protein uup